MPIPSLQTRLTLSLVGLLVFLAGTQDAAAAPVPATLNVQLTTSRGCFETGQEPEFVVGELIQVQFRIGSNGVTHANTTLFDVLPDGRIRGFGFGALLTNVTYAFQSRIAPPAGIERLILRASAPGHVSAQRSCSFRVVSSGTPRATSTVTSTPTPTVPPPTRTATRTRTATTSPAAGLSGSITTNRGCIESGDNPVFSIGDSIVIFFRVSSSTAAQARVAIADFLPSGFVNFFSFGFLPTNATFAFSGAIAPPNGTETLELRAGMVTASTALGRCSFHVVGSSPLATRTRTRTRTRTPTIAAFTATPTPTSTPTP